MVWQNPTSVNNSGLLYYRNCPSETRPGNTTAVFRAFPRRLSRKSETYLRNNDSPPRIFPEKSETLFGNTDPAGFLLCRKYRSTGAEQMQPEGAAPRYPLSGFLAAPRKILTPDIRQTNLVVEAEMKRRLFVILFPKQSGFYIQSGQTTNPEQLRKERKEGTQDGSYKFFYGNRRGEISGAVFHALRRHQ